MSFQAAAWAIDCDWVENTNQKMVLIVLADCHNSETGRCDPSIDFIATKSLLSRRTVERSLSGLESLGIITRKRRANKDGFKTSNSYILNMKDASESRNDASHRRDRCVTVAPMDASESRINQEYINQEKNQETPLYPPWLDMDLWKEWKATRQTGKTKYTKRAQQLAINTLTKLCPDGEGHQEIIDQSIERGWKTFYPLKNNQSFDEQRRSKNDAVFEEFLNG